MDVKVIALVVVLALAVYYFNTSNAGIIDAFSNTPVSDYVPASVDPVQSTQSMPSCQSESFAPEYVPGQQKPAINPEDLIPKDTNSLWASLNPEGEGSLQKQNFLVAGHHFGADSIGSSRKNANLQLRPIVLNPRGNVSPWMNSTVEPDENINGRALTV